ncbi:hypothetical protein GZ77_02355 [Endozoicomonas montiporae]|uniref:5'-3' exonuclease domain-containing protein n=2 Tax=Endozoicomonas montiporae TaxID=1027273 RepID=A0A081NAM5_9GAMM|nr:5'-3' exonuclease H3TH domain-containing protein [Endozoicomonas montiporae]AMO56820.1 exonuclease IX [Endozoicomonas montiporae CL-33]KEQ15498.1 hypothetical protein GZ77_02355 [Endozoicomonas montiporae]
MRPHLLLIDALNLIRRIHAAVKAPDDSSQVDGAISSTVSSLSRALHDSQPSHALVVFDGSPPTWRHELYPDYKSQRKPMPDVLYNRLGDFNHAFLQMGIKTFRRSGLEADDVIASIACKAMEAGVAVTILSTDRSFQQLLTVPGIRLRDHFQKLDHTTETVCQQMGLKPEQLVDYWAMAGNGDIPGVHGVGNKGAAKLMQESGSLEHVFQQQEPKGAAAKVCDQKDQALLSQRLAALATTLELGVRLKDLRYVRE